MPLVMNLASGYRPPPQPSSPAKRQQPPSAQEFAITAAATAAGLLASGCLNIRQKLVAFEEEQQKMIKATVPPAARAQGYALGDTKHAIMIKENELTHVSATIAAVRGAVAERQDFMRGLLPPDMHEVPPTGAPSGKLQLLSDPTGGAPISSRWRPTDTARERVAQRVEERLALAYEAAEAEAARVRAMYPRIEYPPVPPPQQSYAQYDLPWGVSADPHFTADLANGREIDYQYTDPDAHAGAFCTSASAHFIPDLAAVGAGSPIHPPEGRWPVPEVDAAGNLASSDALSQLQRAMPQVPYPSEIPGATPLDEMERQAAERERAMLGAAMAVINGGGQDQPGLSLGATSYAHSSYSMGNDISPERALSRLSALSALGTDDSPEARAAARVISQHPAANAVGPSLQPPGQLAVRGTSDSAAAPASLPMYDPRALQDTRAASAILTAAGGVVRPNPAVNSMGHMGALMHATNSFARAGANQQQGRLPIPTSSGVQHSGSAMLATMLGDSPVAPPQYTHPPAAMPFGGSAWNGMGVPMRAMSAVSSNPAARTMGGADTRALSVGNVPLADGGVGMAASEEEEEEYEYYQPGGDGTVNEDDPSVAQLRELMTSADEAKSGLAQATAAEQAAQHDLTLAEAALVDASYKKEVVGVNLDKVGKLEGEVAEARAREQGLRQMVAQQEQSLEDAKTRHEAAKKKKFASKAKEEASRVVKEEETKLTSAKERLAAALQKVSTLLANAEEVAMVAEEQQAKAEQGVHLATMGVEEARRNLTKAEAQRRDAEAAAADSTAAAERERILLLGQGTVMAAPSMSAAVNANNAASRLVSGLGARAPAQAPPYTESLPGSSMGQGVGQGVLASADLLLSSLAPTTLTAQPAPPVPSIVPASQQAPLSVPAAPVPQTVAPIPPSQALGAGSGGLGVAGAPQPVPQPAPQPMPTTAVAAAMAGVGGMATAAIGVAAAQAAASPAATAPAGLGVAGEELEFYDDEGEEEEDGEEDYDEYEFEPLEVIGEYSEEDGTVPMGAASRATTDTTLYG